MNIGERPVGIVNLRCFPRDFCWIRERDLLGEGDTSAAAFATDAAITELLLLPGFFEILPERDDRRDLTYITILNVHENLYHLSLFSLTGHGSIVILRL